MRKFKCVKEYPGSCKLGEVLKEYDILGQTYYKSDEGYLIHHTDVEDYLEFFEEIKEVKLEVPIGTKFKTYQTGSIYIIKEDTGETVKIYDYPEVDEKCRVWEISLVNEYFRNGSWTIYKEKEFEVLKYAYTDIVYTKNADGKYVTWLDSPYGSTLLPEYFEKCAIVSIKRLKDNTIFTVNDKVCWDWQYSSRNYYTIQGFVVNNDNVEFYTVESGVYKYIFDKIKHYKQPIFLDELGNELYKGDTFYFVNHMFWDLEKGKAQDGDLRTEIHHFKNKADAEKYISDNKPTFSKKDMKRLGELLQENSFKYWDSIINSFK